MRPWYISPRYISAYELKLDANAALVQLLWLSKVYLDN